MAPKIQIDFKFAKNWKAFKNWNDKQSRNGVNFKGAPWFEQKVIIQRLFETTVPNMIDWTQLWFDFEKWIVGIRQKKGIVLWTEQQRQIETLLLNQQKDLNQSFFVVAWLDKDGQPEIDPTKSTYWQALKIKKELEGDRNGVGGNEEIDRITIINLKRLIG